MKGPSSLAGQLCAAVSEQLERNKREREDQERYIADLEEMAIYLNHQCKADTVLWCAQPNCKRLCNSEEQTLFDATGAQCELCERAVEATCVLCPVLKHQQCVKCQRYVCPDCMHRKGVCALCISRK
jgi:hypothetical protein